PAGTGPVARAVLDLLDGVVLTGGLDVSPDRYGEGPRPGLGQVDEDLDALELPLVHAAIERRLPLFGVCRGHQVVNVALGGSLYPALGCDDVTGFPHATPLEKGRDYLAHTIDVAPGSRLSELVGAGRVEVNSFHHQAVRRLAPGLVVTAASPDGVIEGM